MIRARIRLSTSASSPAARVSMPCTNPALGVAPVSDSSSSTHRCDGDELHHHQVHREGLQVRAVPDGPGAGPLRARRGVHRAAAAAHRMLVVLGDRDADLRDLMLLVAVHHPQVGGIGQIVPALAAPLREPILLVIGPVHPGEVRPRGSRLLTLAPLRPTTRAFFAAGGVLPGSSSREGGIEELPELRDSRCSTRASLVASSSFNAVSAAICSACSPTNASSCSRDIASGSSTRRSNYGPGRHLRDRHANDRKDSARHLAPPVTHSREASAPVAAAARAASLIRQLSYPRSSSTSASSRPARFRRSAAASTTSRDSDVSRIRPNGVTYGVDPARSDTLIPSFDVLAAITPNTYNVSGSASASITARASLMATPITVAATHPDRPTRPQPRISIITPKRLNVYGGKMP